MPFDPKFIQPGTAERCLEAGHRCGGIMCGCTCHGADRAQASAMLAQEETNMRAHAAQIAERKTTMDQPLGHIEVVRVPKVALVGLIATLVRSRLPGGLADKAATKMIDRLVAQTAGLIAAQDQWATENAVRQFLLPRDGDVAATPSTDEVARLFAEANDRPDHMGPA